MKQTNLGTLKWGMLGGGPGALIGQVHRNAALLAGGMHLSAGVFSRDEAKSRQMAMELGLDLDRIYPNHHAMVEREAARPPHERLDFVSIVTPNHLHFDMARDFLQAGFHVVCDKPMTINSVQARELIETARQQGRILGLTHNYSGYPMVKLARTLVALGDLGPVRKVVVTYPQGWLWRDVDCRQAQWRTDPAQSGPAGCMGDIGTHAAHLAEYITGLKIQEVCADLTTFVQGRRLDDDGSVLLRLEGGVKGILAASQISVGEANGLSIAVYGERKGLKWRQEFPNQLHVISEDEPEQIWDRGRSYVNEKCPAAARATRLPAGHPEGFVEAFASIYANIADTIRAAKQGQTPSPLQADFPDGQAGLRGLLFIEAVIKSNQSEAKWTQLEE